MIDPNVPSFFLILLTGFACVWTFKKVAARTHIKISDFEYLAFSAIWGSVLFKSILEYSWNDSNLMFGFSNFPFLSTPMLVVLGSIVGAAAALVFHVFLICYKKIFKRR